MILSNPILDGVNVRYELKKPFAVLVKMALHGWQWDAVSQKTRLKTFSS
jgi:hypothetical protein